MAERPLERRLDLHLPELPDREVEVLDRGDALLGVVLEKQLRQGILFQCSEGVNAEDCGELEISQRASIPITPISRG